MTTARLELTVLVGLGEIPSMRKGSFKPTSHIRSFVCLYKRGSLYNTLFDLASAEMYANLVSRCTFSFSSPGVEHDDISLNFTIRHTPGIQLTNS